MPPSALVAVPISREAFAPYGTLIEPSPDGVPAGPSDAVLALAATPRLYVMQLSARPMGFDRITRHKAVGQCLGAFGDAPWYLGVAPPGESVDEDALVVFEVSRNVILALKVGTWHAGPLFSEPVRNFVNLEGARTNEEDHHTVVLSRPFTVQPSAELRGAAQSS